MMLLSPRSRLAVTFVAGKAFGRTLTTMCRLEFVTVKEASETMRRGRLASLYTSYPGIWGFEDLGI